MTTWQTLNEKRHELMQVEKLVTKAMNGCRRAIIELYVTQPYLFEKGTRAYTVLEPYLYKANMVK